MLTKDEAMAVLEAVEKHLISYEGGLTWGKGRQHSPEMVVAQLRGGTFCTENEEGYWQPNSTSDYLVACNALDDIAGAIVNKNKGRPQDPFLSRCYLAILGSAYLSVLSSTDGLQALREAMTAIVEGGKGEEG